MVDVRYFLTEEGMRYDVYSPAKTIKAHILLPKGKDCKELLVNGDKIDFEIEQIESSLYVNFEILAEKKMSFEIAFN